MHSGKATKLSNSSWRNTYIIKHTHCIGIDFRFHLHGSLDSFVRCLSITGGKTWQVNQHKQHFGDERHSTIFRHSFDNVKKKREKDVQEMYIKYRSVPSICIGKKLRVGMRIRFSVYSICISKKLHIDLESIFYQELLDLKHTFIFHYRLVREIKNNIIIFILSLLITFKLNLKLKKHVWLNSTYSKILTLYTFWF